MTERYSLGKRITSVFLALTILLAMIPLTSMAASATKLAQPALSRSVADPGTADTWEQMMGSSADGNRYAGRVWVDKSVYKDGDTAVLNSRGESGSSFQVSLEDDEAFQIIFSALGSSMTTTTTTGSTGPMDVVLVLDTSTSMDDLSGGVTRLQRTIEAANSLIDDLLTINGVRIAIVTYNRDSETVLPLAGYADGIDLVVTDYYNNNSSDAGVVYAYDENDQLLGSDSGYTQGTNLQAGIDLGFNILANAADVEGRAPVAIVLTDGQANRADQDRFYDIDNDGGNSASGRNLYLSTLLNAAYNKTKIEENYGKDATVYTVGVDVSGNTVAQLLMDPADSTYGFKDHGTTGTYREITYAYRNFQTWAGGENVTYNGWTFDHNYPSLNGAVTDAKIAANIYYADIYYPVDSADLQTTFDQIFEELSSGAFNPISDSTTVDGAIGVDNTPLIYVDWIGQHMEIKEIQSVTLFGASYAVINNGNGTYTVAAGTGTNPATKEEYNTSEDIAITVSEDDGVQKLEIRINQEILPILMEQVISKTIGSATTATITEVMQEPLRVYYTVGIDSDILLPNGEIDVSRIQGYEYIDEANGTVSFYSNRFGVKNAGVNGVVSAGDAHVGFKPSAENRYYYHQANQRIFSSVTNADGSAIAWDADLYGVPYTEGSFNLTDLDYATYLRYNAALDDADNPVDHQVYTYVSFYRPTADQTDAANTAELVTYLVYTNWSDLRESVAFYDATTQKYVNYSDGAYTLDDVGYVMTAEHAADYMAANASARLYAVLGMGSLRTSRFHNMIKAKTENLTGSATLRYDPEYTYGLAAQHNNNDVVVWLGNNGKLTVSVDTGITLTKNVTEAIGNPDDTYALTVTIPADVIATPVVTDMNGNDVTASISTYMNNVLTVNLKAGESVYISGIPGGTVCIIGENIPDGAEYYIASQTDTVTVPTVSEALNGAAQYASAQVTNAPVKYGNLFITKEITGNYEIPESILEKEFTITVNVGVALAGETLLVEDSATDEPYTVTVDADGTMVFTIKARQTIEVLNLPVGTVVTVTESDPGANFEVSYKTRDHSGADADSDNAVTIFEGADATAVVINHYTPAKTTVDLDIEVTKNFEIEGDHDGATFDFKVQRWNGSEYVDIGSASVTYSTNEKGEKTVTINDVLDGIEYTHVGFWAYQVIEVRGDVANVTYDRTLYTFTVIVTDNGGQLVATVTDMNNAVIADGSYEVTFKNTYNTAPISMDITKIVENNSGDDAVSGAGFKFRARAVDAEGNALSPDAAETATNTIYTDAAGEARISGYYTTTGTYYYIVWEDASANLPGWTYSKAEYFITVTVSDDGTGNLSSVMTIEPWNAAAEAELAAANISADALVTNDNEGHLYFTNTFDPDDVTVNLDAAVAKELTGRPLEAGMFTFYVFENDEGYLRDYDNALLRGTNGLDGSVKFVDFEDVLTFDKVGKYEYDIVEFIPENAVLNTTTGMYELNGISYDPTIYDLVIEVALNTATGKLEASCYFEDAIGQVVTFHNRYEATPTAYQLGGVKILSGRAMQAGEFSFTLYEGERLIQTVVNKADGSFVFDTIEYTQSGTYTYTVKEAEPAVAAPGVTYEGVNNPVTVTVTVRDNNGVLSASANVSNINIRFENTYVADPVYVSFAADKTFVGGELMSDMFFFGLYAVDNSFVIPAEADALAVVSCDADGVAWLGTVKFEKTGTYFFAVAEETQNPIDGIVYDTAQHNYIVTVRDHGTGKLEATVQKVGSSSSVSGYGTVSAAVATFENATFDEVVEKEVAAQNNPEINIDGKKVYEGEILTYFITYTNYTGQDVVVDIMDTIPEYTSYVEGSASHNGSYVGTHILWTMNVPDGESVTVSFDVRVDQTQVIVTNTAVIRDGVNTYTTNEVVNHTVNEQLQKDVFSPDDVTVSIDGNKVYSGDELLYKVSFTNASAQTVDVVITDKIPVNTTYVDGSADNGGIYAKGEIVWNLNVSAWQTAVVSFKVKVDENIGAVTIENAATATDGSNSYETNIVTNHTVEDEVQKEVYSAENPGVSIDGRKVYAGDTLVYEVSYRNTGPEKVTVIITDAIPEYTVYVDGSADNDGVYNDGVITWTLEVESGESVTVSFRVTVEDAGNVTVSNVAEVKEGRNTYNTNEVTNYTVNDEVSKEVFSEYEPDINIDGRKVYVGDILTYAISYTNSASESVSVKITDIIPEYTAYVENSADNGGVYSEGVIVWELEVDAGATVTVTFKVTVSDEANAVTIANEASVQEGKNTYYTNEVINYTTEDEVTKQVFHTDAPAVNIDGRNVDCGDILIYAISYTNTSYETVTVSITDTVPTYTSYVPGSADNGGVYNNGVITWTLEVAAGASVTVSFKAKVEWVESAVITNEATVVEGRNTYTSNVVTNPTVNDIPDNPKTGDNGNQALWVALMLSSGGAAITLCVCSRKKKRTEED